MGYATWTIGSEVIPHVREAKIDTTEGTITLSCSALNWNIKTGDSDPRDEIARIQSLTSQYINNEPLLNGGTKLQVGGISQILTVTDGTDTYTRCALEPVQIQEDHKSTKRIDYELIIHYELSGSGGSFVYTPDYTQYPNILYYMWTDLSNPATTHPAYGNELGHITITETKNVKRVEVYGSGDCGETTSDCWIELNGDRRYWKYTDAGDKKLFPANNLEVGEEKHTWILDSPTNSLVFETSTHVYDGDVGDCDLNKGCWLRWIKVVYE